MASPHIRWNVAWHVLDGVFFFASLAVVSFEIVVPTMITELGGSAFLLGAVPFIWWTGVLIPQVYYAKKVEGLAYKKPRVVACALAQRVGWLVFLASLHLRWAPAFTIPVFFAVLAANSVGTGFLIPVWADWYAKTVPGGLWGRVFGWRRAISGALGVGLGGFVHWVIDAYPAPVRYQILTWVAVGFLTISFVSVILVKEEHEDGLPTQEGTSWPDYFRGLAWILFRRRDFRRFVGATFLVTTPLSVVLAYLTRYGLEHPDATDALAGTFTVFYFAARAVGSYVGGHVCDERGPIAAFRLFPVLCVAGVCVAVASARPATVCLAWGLVGFGFGMRMVIMMPAVFRYAGPHRRPSYMAASFVAVALGSAVAPPLVGLLIDAGVIGYTHAFLLSALATIAGWAMFLRMPAPEAAPA
ncbi:MAG: MFS transporter [Planctomycetota bacterium]